MLNEIPTLPKPTETLTLFLRALDLGGFLGGISTKRADRVIVSTDNSIWQCTPSAVLTPKCHEDIALVLKLLEKKENRQIAITPRGAGTSTSGQTLTTSIVLDCKRYLHGILQYNEELKQVTVSSGSVLDSVNQTLEEYGVMLGPTVATASRATIGGMIGNDSAGKGSSVYGKMSDCVVELSTVVLGGKTITTSAMDAAIVHSLEQSGDFYGLLCGEVQRACERAQPHLEQHWPQLPRFLSGYNLPMTWNKRSFNLNRILCGSEGTLGVTTSAVLQCVEIPKLRKLLLICFNSFDCALTCGAALKQFMPIAIETVDDMVIEAARNSNLWRELAPLLGTCKDDVHALLFVEFAGDSQQIEQACAFATEYENSMQAIIASEKAEIDIVWKFRARSVGLLSSIAGDKRPIPFVEDCAVPPEFLAPFIQDFRALLKNHSLQAGMFGHVDAGVIHVRPALNIESKADRELVQTITNEVATLVQSYGGVLWGEHGKGFRSSHGPKVFGDAIWEQMCAIKKAFDPHNQLNPGKVALPDVSMNLKGLDEPTRGEHDSKIAALPILASAKKCDGNSECLSSTTTNNMCPTYRATRDVQHSPRGRADLIRTWLGEITSTPIKRGTFIQKIKASSTHCDFSHEVYEALEGCLSCKACANDCPMQIDIPAMRSEFYDAYFGRYFRPIRDHVWFNMERMLPILASPIGKLLPTRFLGTLIGIVDTPKVHRKHKLKSCSPEEAIANNATVVLLQDTFTTYFRSEVLIALNDVLNKLGHSVAILHCKPNGKAFHIRGNLPAFHTVARQNTQWIKPLTHANIPIVGIDPAATLLWRDEYVSATGVRIPVLLPQEFLIEQDLSALHCSGTFELLPHCIEHALAPDCLFQWEHIFTTLGATLTLQNAACCGMGGLFGHQQEFREQSLHIWKQNWAPHNPSNERTLATGYSCVSQAKRVERLTLRHPLEVISSHIVT